jgi:hypothetical protein
VPRLPGTLIDSRYRVVRYLGSGSFGEVYEVEDEHQGVRVALKFLNATPGAPAFGSRLRS